MGKWPRILSSLLVIVSVTACSPGTNSSSSQSSNYKETKTMVIDILKTDDGKNTIIEALKQKSGSKGSPMEIQWLTDGGELQIKNAVKEVLTDEQSSKMLRKMMTDPKFAGEFAKAIIDENKQLHKDLMNDPEYQKSMLSLMKDAEFEKMLIDVMKGQQYRRQTMNVIQESLKSPLFQAELTELLKKAMNEQTKPKKEEGNSGSENSSHST